MNLARLLDVLKSMHNELTVLRTSMCRSQSLSESLPNRRMIIHCIHHIKTLIGVLLRLLATPRVHGRPLARGLSRFANGLNRLIELRIEPSVGFDRVSDRIPQIKRSDKTYIDARHRGDILDTAQRGLGFNLHDDERAGVGLFEVLRDGNLRRVDRLFGELLHGERTAQTAVTLRREFAVFHDVSGVVDRLQQRDDDPVGARVQSPFDHPMLSFGHAYHGTHAARRDGRHAVVHVHVRHVAVLAIDADPVDVRRAGYGSAEIGAREHLSLIR